MNKTFETSEEAIMRALFSKNKADGYIRIGNTQFVQLLSVEREDGSGWNFNIGGIDVYGQRVTVFCSLRPFDVA